MPEGIGWTEESSEDQGERQLCTRPEHSVTVHQSWEAFGSSKEVR